MKLKQRRYQNYHGDHETLRDKEPNDVFLLSDMKCVFPFIYRGIKFVDCTSYDSIFLWCSLNADYTGDGNRVLRQVSALSSQEGVSRLPR